MEPIRLTRDLYAEGYAYPELARLRTSGELRALRRGAYSLDPSAPPDSRTVHRELVHATARALTRDDAVVSHMSAAALHGLPLWESDLTTVHLTCGRDGGGRRRRDNFIHVCPIDAHEIVEIEGIRVTTLARTVVDLSRGLTAYKFVPLGDAALRQGLDRDELTDAVARCRGWRGIVRARRAVAFLDPRSESVGESCSLVRMAEVGLPRPDLQVKVFDDHGYLVGRTDFGWLDRRTLGEFDGATKYGPLRRPDQTAEDVVLAEKDREDALRDEGFQVVRWRWDALEDPTILRRKIMNAFARAR
ncbi:hypothetical protein GCM10022204_45480 [Microlunatus aurantiacus]|uniref:Transcriptional regulator, AbiEi antitoxin, Type IV TA system n=1 Tax=Microlunatus aurantiacus TaxID=446786 RepID=A0ABP7EM19_9ACTN